MVMHALDDGELDMFDLVRDLESAFGMRIEDREAERLQTLAGLHRLILTKCGAARAPACLSTATCCRARAALADVFGLDKHDVRPSTPLVHLIGRPAPERWRQLAARLGLKEVSLGRSRQTRRAMLYASTAVGAVAFITALAAFGGICAALAVAVPTLVLAWSLAVVITLPLAVYPPFATAGELAQSVLAARFAEFAERAWLPTEREVWDKMARLVAEYYGTQPEELIPATRFVGEMQMADAALAWLGAR
jgi:hypothetical protein